MDPTLQHDGAAATTRFSIERDAACSPANGVPQGPGLGTRMAHAASPITAHASATREQRRNTLHGRSPPISQQPHASENPHRPCAAPPGERKQPNRPTGVAPAGPADRTLFAEYMQRYLANDLVREWLLCRDPEGVRYADSFRDSLSYACLYYVPSKRGAAAAAAAAASRRRGRDRASRNTCDSSPAHMHSNSKTPQAAGDTGTPPANDAVTAAAMAVSGVSSGPVPSGVRTPTTASASFISSATAAVDLSAAQQKTGAATPQPRAGPSSAMSTASAVTMPSARLRSVQTPSSRSSAADPDQMNPIRASPPTPLNADAPGDETHVQASPAASSSEASRFQPAAVTQPSAPTTGVATSFPTLAHSYSSSLSSSLSSSSSVEHSDDERAQKRPGEPPKRYTKPAPFLDSGDLMMFHTTYDNFAVGSLYTTREHHALAQLRDSVEETGLSTIPKSRRFATDLSVDALEVMEFAWLMDESLIVSCRKLQKPVGAPPEAGNSLAIQGDILFYGIIPKGQHPGIPLKRLRLYEKPVMCSFCGSRGFTKCRCPSSFKRRAPSADLAGSQSRKMSRVSEDGTGLCSRSASTSNDALFNTGRASGGSSARYGALGDYRMGATGNDAFDDASDAVQLSKKRSRDLATFSNFTSRLYSIDQSGSFFVHWYVRVPNTRHMRTWAKPRNPIPYQFICGTREQTNVLSALFIKDMDLCASSFLNDARFYGSLTNGADIGMLVSKDGIAMESDTVDDATATNARYGAVQNTDCDERTQNALVLRGSRAMEMPLVQRRSSRSRLIAQPSMEEVAAAAVTGVVVPNGTYSGVQRVARRPGVGSPASHVQTPPQRMSEAVTAACPAPDAAFFSPQHQVDDKDGARFVEFALEQSIAVDGNPTIPLGLSSTQQTVDAGGQHDILQLASGIGGNVDGSPHSQLRAAASAGAAEAGLPIKEFSFKPDENALTADSEGSEPADGEEDVARVVYRPDGSAACSKCDASFRKLGNLTRHIQTVHLKLKPFQCDQCDTRFGYKTHLNRHIQTVHNKTNEYKCGDCNREFRTQQQLDRHQQQAHSSSGSESGQIKCEFCGHGFSQRSNLNRHIQSIHRKMRHTCAACSNSFGQRFDMQRHILRYAESGDAAHVALLEEQRNFRNVS